MRAIGINRAKAVAMESLARIPNTSIKLQRSTRRRTLQIQVEPNGSVLVRAPKRMSERVIKQFLIDKQYWIAEKKLYYKTHTLPIIKKGEWANMNKNIARAKKYFRDVVKEVNEHYQFAYKEIRVKKMRSRWGSCSANKVLTFNYDLLFLDQDLLRYVVVHELCHLKEMNHSKRFWRLVEKSVPEYKKCVGRLNKYILE